jgi:3-hydroxybutyrate dehydrogenase
LGLKSLKNFLKSIFYLNNNFKVITMPTKPLKDKTALITGSTSGIGLGIARSLAAQGANIVFNGFGDISEINALTAAAAQEFGIKTAYNGADMSKPEQIANMMQETVKKFGGIDILVNNAGIQHVANIEDFPIEKWDAIIAINLSSAFHTTRLALPGMKAKNWGRIINVASVHGLVASAQKSAYVAAKHGLIGFTKTTALETATTGITCNAICPGWVLTPLVQKQVDARAEKDGVSNELAKKSLLSEKQPSEEFVTPEQLGALAVFFCSDAANQIRGVAWNMDGGWVAQ